MDEHEKLLIELNANFDNLLKEVNRIRDNLGEWPDKCHQNQRECRTEILTDIQVLEEKFDDLREEVMIHVNGIPKPPAVQPIPYKLALETLKMLIYLALAMMGVNYMG